MIFKSVIRGLTSMAVLLAVYFSIVSLVSGGAFALEQFSKFWYFIVSLAFGFGVQIGLYTYLKNAVHHDAPKGMVAVSGTTSTVAMLSCCAHYLVNILPVIAIGGAVAFVSQYQIQLFWFGLVSNAIGIAYIANKIIKFSRQNAK